MCKKNNIISSNKIKIVNPKILSKNFNDKFLSRRKKDKECFNFWLNSTYITLLSLIICLLLYYVWILNINATKWYDIRILEIEKKNLLMEKEILDVQIAEFESLPNILKDEDLKNMEKIESPDHIVIKENIQYVYKN